MKKIIIFLIIATGMLIPSKAFSQVPRIRTSASPEQTAQRVEVKPARTDNSSSQVSVKAKAPRSLRYMAIKTNVAYDAMTIANVAFEMEVSPKITVSLPLMLSLWDMKSDLGLRIFGIQPEARYWFDKAGHGHALGVNLGVASYNFRNGDFRYQNVDGRPIVSAAVSYAYKFDITDNWGVELSASLGYANTRYNRYYNIDNGAKINEKTIDYWGPTQIGVTLTYTL